MLVFDLLFFIIFFIVSYSLRPYFFRSGHPATSAGGIIMSLSVFSSFALTQLPFYSQMMGRLAAIEVFIIWLFIASKFVKTFKNHKFIGYLNHYLQRFAVGTWVAGTAVLAILISRTLPEMNWLNQLLTLISIILYVPYLVVFVRGYIDLWRHPLRQHSNGIILLSAVATESIIIAVDASFSAELPRFLLLGMIVFGLVFVCSGLVLVFLNYAKLRSQYLATRWKNTNCIIHGALSITGLALVTTVTINKELLVSFWLFVLSLFVIIEFVELIRMIQRTRRYGLTNGLLVYDVSQWTRNFTFGMFYAFSLSLFNRIEGTRLSVHDFWQPVLHWIVSYGQFVVFALLIVELVVFVKNRFHIPNAVAVSLSEHK